MKAQVLTDMSENELNDLLVIERERLVKMKMSHAVYKSFRASTLHILIVIKNYFIGLLHSKHKFSVISTSA